MMRKKVTADIVAYREREGKETIWNVLPRRTLYIVGGLFKLSQYMPSGMGGSAPEDYVPEYRDPIELRMGNVKTHGILGSLSFRESKSWYSFVELDP